MKVFMLFSAEYVGVLLGNYLVHRVGFVFRHVFTHVANSEFQRLCAENYLDYVALLDVIGSLYSFAIYNDVLAVAGIVCNRSALDYARNL